MIADIFYIVIMELIRGQVSPRFCGRIVEMKR